MKNKKIQLRKNLLVQLQNFSASEKTKQQQKIEKLFLNSEEYSQAKVIGFYASLPTEVETCFLIKQSLNLNKQIALPRISGKNLEFHEIQSLTNLEIKQFKIREPNPNLPKVKLRKLDLLVVPALAFDQQNNRLGRGLGFYDRILAKFVGISVGLAFDFQILLKLPVDNWDQKISKIFSVLEFR
jgi:5-formyltetrahydrofolate cyclo-ligase